jgi:class 3 adenylate cyclase
MDCPNCGRPNREQANYCRHCGAHFALTCPRCRAVLVEDSRFCDHCGFDLARPGPAPAQPPSAAAAAPALPAVPAGSPALDQYIPPELMSKLTAARETGVMVGERRVVTMLFCDVKGSTHLAERLDPEDYTEIINGAFAHMIAPVYKYEGTLARLMGDALLAFFGAPIAHEDDPQRAVLAGLDIVAAMAPYREQVRAQWGVDFNVRVGINTGLVVVGAVGSDLRLEYSALGDAINLAARMEQTAAPGAVQIAHDTYRHIETLFEVEPLGALPIKGKREPVRTYRVLRRKTLAGPLRGIAGLRAELVGREAELRALSGVMHDLQRGVGRIVCILGEAGLGKSRLVAEARQIFDGLFGADDRRRDGPAGAPPAWLSASSLSYEAHDAYGLFQRLLRRLAGVDYDTPPEQVRAGLEPLAAGLPPEAQARAARVFAALLGVAATDNGLALEGDAFRRELLEAMQALWRARFAGQPAVLALDDMHWSDGASVDLLCQLLPLTAEMPLVLICALRAERQAPAWQLRRAAEDEHRHNYVELDLAPLTEAESGELLNRLLATPDLPGRLRASILEKSAGNPYFIEEVVRTLIETGAVTPEDRLENGVSRRYWVAASAGADFAIPDNLQRLLAARLDRLEEATRGTLQLAAVIGRSFHHRVLAAVDEGSPALDQRLRTLLQLEMIREAARLPEIEYAFRNPLTQEAVYQTILMKGRRRAHQRVGEAIESLYPDRLDRFAGLLAHHFAQAGARAKAAAYARQAAQQAVGLFAYEEAAQNLRAALDQLDPEEVSDLRLGLLEELADAHRLLRDGAAAIIGYQQALAVCAALAGADPLARLRLNRKIVEVVADLKWSVGLEDFQRANAQAEAARAGLEAEVARRENEPPHPETVRGLAALCTDAWRVQAPPDWDLAQRRAEQAVALAERLANPLDLSQALGALATVLDGRSRLREHLAVAQRRLAVCMEAPNLDQRERLEAQRCVGAALMYVGEYAAARPYLAQAEALAVQVHAVDQQANAIGLQVQCAYRLDEWEAVLGDEAKWRTLEQRYSRGRVGETCFFVALSGSVHALRGDSDRALAYADESYQYMVGMSGQPDQWQRNQFY